MGARGGGVVLNVSSMVFLCSDEALFITGEALKVSGGHPLNF
jgi:NAD(P)-dependent dehydrogenase (short-subunit alcohol dehydrogenase family)